VNRSRLLPVLVGLGLWLGGISAASAVWGARPAGPHSDDAAGTSGLGVLSRTLTTIPRQVLPKNVTATPDQNEWNPRFSPNGRYLSFERRNGSAQAIFVVDTLAPGGAAERISSQPTRAAASAEEALLGGSRSDDSFNAQISFYPDAKSFVFTGNAGTGIYRLYEGTLGGAPPKALTAQSKEDGHPAVSPDGRWLVYVSARAGIGKLFLRDLTTGAERQLTTGDKVDLYPAWSPDSRTVAYTSGDNDNHDVFVIDALAPSATPRQLSAWKYDDLRPTFSPDGSLVAFYSNYSPTGEEKEWSILAVPADGSGPSKGAALAKLVVAVNVVTDLEVGPAWLPWGRTIVYARNLKAEWNPIYIVDTETREELRLETQTRMNHDLTCSRTGLLAFRAQVASWDDIFVAALGRTP
jgi:Tol biopolymer transport system component